MANQHLLHELLMFSKTSNRKMTVEEAISEYLNHFIDDCEHIALTKLISLENTLREYYEYPILKDREEDIRELLTRIALAQNEEFRVECNGEFLWF